MKLETCMFIIVGPSGAGKSSFLDKIIQDRPEIIDTITNTTRPMRAGESQGIPYDFITEAEFKKRREENQYIEWAEVHGFYYGTPKSEIERITSMGNSMIMDVDIQGAASFKKFYPEAISIFILPPSIDALRERVRNRDGKTLSDEQLEVRMKNAEIEIKASEGFDYRVVNDDFDKSYESFKKIVDKHLNKL